MIWVALGVALISLAVTAYQAYKAATQETSLQPGQFERPTAEEAKPIGVLFGRATIKRTIVAWVGDLAATRIVVQGGTLIPEETPQGLRPPGYEYHAGMHLVLCHGKLDGILGIFRGKKAVWTGYQSTDRAVEWINTYGRLAAGGGDGIYGAVEFRMGAHDTSGVADAGIKDYLAQQQHLTKGPRYYGLASLIFLYTDWGINPMLPPLAVAAERILTTNGGNSEQWYVAKARLVIGKDREDVWKYKLEAPGDDNEEDYIDPEYDDSSWATGRGGIGNAPTGTDMSLLMENYWLPVVRTSIHNVGGFCGSDSGGNRVVNEGMKIWMRADLGPLPLQRLGVRCWHDDSGDLWFNGEVITLKGMDSDSHDFSHYNSTGTITADMINAEGPNIVAYRVRDSFSTSGVRIGKPQHVYAGIQIGPDPKAPESVVGMNPAHAIREVLLDQYIGRGYSYLFDIDNSAFTAMADTLWDERFGISIFWDREGTSADDLIKELLRTVGGVLYTDPITGLLTPKLIREDYDPETLVELDEQHIVQVLRAKRVQAGEGINTVVVKYTGNLAGDAATSAPAIDVGGVAAAGRTIVQTVTYTAVCDPAIAARLAWRDLVALTTPAWSFEVQCDRTAAVLRKGDAFKITWPDLEWSSMICRVLEIGYGDGSSNVVTMKCVENVFSLPDVGQVGTEEPGGPDVTVPTFVGEQTRFITAHVVDPDNRGSVLCVMSTPGEGANLSGWTEDPVGTFTRTSTGSLTSDWFDGVDPEQYLDNGHSWLEGKTVLVFKAGIVADEWRAQTGVFIVEDSGAHWEPYLDSEILVSTNARVRRHPDYCVSGDFDAGMTFQVQTGDTYAQDFLTLTTDGVVLGTTPLDWDVTAGPLYNWDAAYALVDPQQAVEWRALPDVEDLTWTSGGSSGAVPDFPTLVASPGVSRIPAGQWVFQIEEIEVQGVGGTPDGDTTLGLRIEYAIENTIMGTLFEVRTEPLTVGAAYTPEPIRYNGPSIPFDSSWRLVYRFHGYTESTVPVTIRIRYSSPQHGTAVLMPLRLLTTASSNVIVLPPSLGDDLLEVALVDGILAGFGDSRRLRVTGSGPLLGIETAGITGSPELFCVFDEAMVITHLAADLPDTVAQIFVNDPAEGESGNLTLSHVNSNARFLLHPGLEQWLCLGTWSPTP